MLPEQNPRKDVAYQPMGEFTFHRERGKKKERHLYWNGEESGAIDWASEESLWA